MNAIAANELKRHGISAIEKLLPNGPVHVIKHNHSVCVVLSEEEYERLALIAGKEATLPQHSVMEWFSLPSLGLAEKADLDDRLSLERDGWEKP